MFNKYSTGKKWCYAFSGLLAVGLTAGCSKLLSVPSPTSQITSQLVFNTDKSAESAMVGVYTNLVSGSGQNGALDLFAAGLSTLIGGLSSDELSITLPNSILTASLYGYNSNHIITDNTGTTGMQASSDNIWKTAYNAIYGANAVIAGIAASTSGALHDSVRNVLTAEAKGLRAFCYFYLVNFFGDVPLLTSPEPITQITASRTPTAQVYNQIISDLTAAQAALPGDYSAGNGNRIRFNKWVATALLARVYLYTKQYDEAAKQATNVINNTSLFGIESNLNNVFLTGSREAIWQLQQNVKNNSTGNAVPESSVFIPYPLNSGIILQSLSPQLLRVFEPNDMRRINWMDSTSFDLTAFGGGPGTYYFSFKYKTGLYNNVVGGTPTEFYMVLRLAEQYLIRAEAEANTNNTQAAVTDINVLRQRAGLPPLSTSLNQADVLAAVAHERQVELFCEWGHRWFDLKRTAQAHNVLSQITLKQPWAGDYQLLYPLPYSDLLSDSKLVQNPGY